MSTSCDRIGKSRSGAPLLGTTGRPGAVRLQFQTGRPGGYQAADQGDRGDARALWLSAHSRAAAAGRLGGERQRIYRLYKDLGLQLQNKTPKRRVKAKLRDDRCAAMQHNETWAELV
ncbi:hypothetical protein MPC1_9600003 [Methylocella tundrae]|nr:hypothetical protein MPC1_9600003 [Methylocella tundrae]